MLGLKLPTELPPGDYDAVVVLQAAPVPGELGNASKPIEPMEPFLDRMRREHLEAALARTGGNRTQAAKLLGVDVRTVFRLIDKDPA
ncbi:MAG: helix-turn-helix domain-containing protein [Polyangiaceae bacterium]|nr:helix-turn-helix domain-containing protein [Polyangiaceae bacterium]